MNQIKIFVNAMSCYRGRVVSLAATDVATINFSTWQSSVPFIIREYITKKKCYRFIYKSYKYVIIIVIFNGAIFVLTSPKRRWWSSSQSLQFSFTLFYFKYFIYKNKDWNCGTVVGLMCAHHRIHVVVLWCLWMLLYTQIAENCN